MIKHTLYTKKKKEARNAQKRVLRDTKLTKLLHDALLPEKAPLLDHYDVATVWVPAKDFAGDFYLFSKRKNQLAFSVGDVADKGLAAALYMDRVYSTLKTGLDLIDKWKPGNLLDWLNLELIRSTSDTIDTMKNHSMFVTMMLGVLDTRYNTIEYARAGHERPFIINAQGKLLYNGAGQGTALGLFEDIKIETGCFYVPPGGMLVSYTDGISDEINLEKKKFGIDRLEDILIQNRHLPAQEICDITMKELVRYRAKTPQYDDCTIMIIKRDDYPDSFAQQKLSRYFPRAAKMIYGYDPMNFK